MTTVLKLSEVYILYIALILLFKQCPDGFNVYVLLATAHTVTSHITHK